METDTEIDELEALIPDDEIDHGVCIICYPPGIKPSLSLCGTDVTGSLMIPFAESVNHCKVCIELGMPHQFKHLLGRI